MEWLMKLAASAGSAAGIVLGLAAVIGWLLKERARLMGEIATERKRVDEERARLTDEVASERQKREDLHEKLHRIQATYGQTLLGVAHRLEERTRSPRD